jgi:pyruvate dehydrogenase E1 component alpha subunit
MHGHFVGDPQVYRSKDDIREAAELHDPITHLRDKIGVPDEEFEKLDAEITQTVEEAVEFAKNGTDPAPEDALKNIYA